MNEMNSATGVEAAETVIIGAGQAGLATAYHLTRRGREVVLLDAADAVGASWRNRWDSLRLFTPTGYTQLPGMPAGGDRRAYPGKDVVADYLEAYADRFHLPVLLGTRVEAVRRDGETFLVFAGGRCWRARNVVIASGAHSTPVVPALAGELNAGVLQMHARDYRRPSQLPPGPVLVVGAGNSGAEIALDLAADTAAARQVFLAGRDVGHTPQLGLWTYPVMQRLGVAGAALARRALRGGGDPLGRVRPGQLEAAGIQRLPRLLGSRDGRPVLADGSPAPEVVAVVWATGLQPDYTWLHLDAFDDTGRLRHRAGVVPDHPGLYAVGLPYQRAVTSHLLGGVGADALYVVKQIDARLRRA